ncbi:MAG: exodeoxyribonuclease VII large subunit [Bdellovibrionota bacterium]
MNLFDTQSELNFDGDLKDEESIVTVSELTESVKSLLEDGIGEVSVRGEISNWRPAASGHIYFSLKDADATIASAFFKGAAAKARHLNLRDGVEVICRGRISVYAPRGTYQIIVESIKPVGAGSLQEKFEALKKKLQAEGLFNAERKRSLPLIPSRIVVITSPTGAAIRDVLSVLKRRSAGVSVLIIPALVQGEAAAAQLILALRQANEHSLGDVILLTRGGGSLEDLWCFNDEQLAREIYNSKIPVVSAVGHEVDFTIADFVADLRAATPSAAAELLVQEQSAILENLRELELRLVRTIRNELEQASLRVAHLIAQLKNPRDRINDLRLRFDDWQERLSTAMERKLQRSREKILRFEGSLHALSPLKVLERGYSIAFSAGGECLKSVSEAPAGTKFTLRLHDGSIAAESKG